MAKPTMQDVATLAGVDRSTVSRALNSETQGRLSKETVRRVEQAAAELGYRPNVLASGLRKQQSFTVGMLIPDLTNPFFPPIVRGLESSLQARGYTLIVINTDNDADVELASLETLATRQVDGLVLATVHLSQGDLPLMVTRRPTVLVNRKAEGNRLSSVVPDETAAVREVVEHLVGLGHTKLAHIAGPQDVSTGHDRRSAFEQSCRDAGLPPPAVEVASAFRREAGLTACQGLLEQGADFTAIFAANDLLAIGCYEALHEAGRAVPGDVSVVGYNDMPLVDMIDPPLTTVRVPQYEMGKEAARLLLEELGDGDTMRGRSVQLPSHLVLRDSTAPR